MVTKALISNDLVTKLQDAGLMPKNLHIRRIVIDLMCGEAVKIYYETFADEKTINLCIEKLISSKHDLDVESVRVLKQE